MTLEQKIDYLISKVEAIEGDISTIKTDVSEMKEDIRKIVQWVPIENSDIILPVNGNKKITA